MKNDFVRAIRFESKMVYHSSRKPGYAAWVSFFPGEDGKWYIGCEEVYKPKNPLARMTREQWYAFGLPSGYDKSEYQMEMLLLESDNNLKKWKLISRKPCRYQHSAGQFGQARTKDGRFLRFLWSCYSLQEDVNHGEILCVSEDEGNTWVKQPSLYDNRMAAYPHRLRTLNDGTLVLALPLSAPFNIEHPRTARNPNVDSHVMMTVCFSFDQGRSWSQPMPIYGGKSVSETDFVELPSGDLLFINNSIFPEPGRQIIYRSGDVFTPSLFEKVKSYEEIVPETVAITEEGLLIGCMRGPYYAWSDDLGLTWYTLEGIPDNIVRWKNYGNKGGEVYQPWIQYLGCGRFACAGHYGGDDPIEKDYDNYIMIHDFQVKVLNKTQSTEIKLIREYDETRSKWSNTYTITLTCNNNPLKDKIIEIWYVERWKPGYDPYLKESLEERMKKGGEVIKANTGLEGKAQILLPQLDEIEDIHHSIQLVASFNVDRNDREYKPAITDIFEFYSNWYQ